MIINNFELLLKTWALCPSRYSHGKFFYWWILPEFQGDIDIIINANKIYYKVYNPHWASQWLSSKEFAYNAGTAGDLSSIRSLEKGNGNPLQYSCLENSMDRGAWRVTVHRAAKSWTQLSMNTYNPHMLYVFPENEKRKIAQLILW